MIYVLIHLCKNSRLPWNVCKGEGHVKVMKESLGETESCKNIPKVFYRLLVYARGLKFNEMPNYELMK